MSVSKKQTAAVVAFSLVCMLGGTYAGNSVLEKSQEACRTEHNLPKDFFKHSRGISVCPELRNSTLIMALTGWGSGISGLIAGAVIAGRKKKAPTNPAP